MGVFDLSFEKPKPVRIDQNLSVVPPSAAKPKVAAKATTSVALYLTLEFQANVSQRPLFITIIHYNKSPN